MAIIVVQPQLITTTHFRPCMKLVYYTVNPSNLEKNQEIHLHHHCQACLIYHFNQGKTPLSMHTIQCRIQVRLGFFIKWMQPTWPERRHSNDLENPDDPTRLNPDAVNMQPIRKMLPYICSHVLASSNMLSAHKTFLKVFLFRFVLL